MATDRQSRGGPVRFGVIGVNHNHILGMTNLLLKAGAELATCFSPRA